MFKSVKKQFFITVVSVMVVIVVSLSTSYAMFSDVQDQTVENVIKSGTLEIKFDDLENGIGNVINLEGAFPISDEEGLSSDPYVFRVSNVSDTESIFRVMLLDDVDLIELEGDAIELLDHSNIKFSINGSDPMLLSDIAYNGYMLDETLMNSLEEATYELRVWIDEDAGNDALGKHYFGKIVVDGSQTPTSNSCFSAVGDTLVDYVDNCVSNVVLPITIDEMDIIKIDSNVFSGQNLNSIVISSKISDIGDNVFSNNNLKVVDIPSNVVSIGNNAFSDNVNLEKIIVHGKNSLDEFNYLGENWNGNAVVEFVNE